MIRSTVAILSGYLLLMVSRLPDVILREMLNSNNALPQPVWFLGYILFSAATGAASGYITAGLARRAEMRHAFALSLLFLCTGLILLKPVSLLSLAWYHFGFLVLMLPCIFLGALFRQIRKPHHAV